MNMYIYIYIFYTYTFISFHHQDMITLAKVEFKETENKAHMTLELSVPVKPKCRSLDAVHAAAFS